MSEPGRSLREEWSCQDNGSTSVKAPRPWRVYGVQEQQGGHCGLIKASKGGDKQGRRVGGMKGQCGRELSALGPWQEFEFYLS